MKLKGFLDTGDGVLKGKGISALQNSKASRNDLIALFGGIENLPSSVMRAKRPKPDRETDAPVSERGYQNTLPGLKKVQDKRLPKILRQAYSSSGKGCSAGALSTFPQAIGRSMVLLYSDPGQVVFDPFAGHNSRMDLCVRAGRHYIACDLSTAFMEFNQKRANQLHQLYPKTIIKLHHCNSRKVPYKDESADFTITSPPYWDIEFYGDEEGQLGLTKTYKDFLEGIGQVLCENYRVLRPDSYAVWFINDFRRKGKFHVYHADIMRLGRKAGFIVHDLLIVDFGPGIRDCFT